MVPRRRLRLCAAALLVFQAASLSAFVPRDCCAGHRVAVAQEKPLCHETDRRSDDNCSLSGTCSGPMAAMVALLSNPGIPIDRFAMSPDVHPGDVVAEAHEDLISRLPPPEPPPPRA
jgi:hypothetical protein